MELLYILAYILLTIVGIWLFVRITMFIWDKLGFHSIPWIVIPFVWLLFLVTKGSVLQRILVVCVLILTILIVIGFKHVHISFN